MDLQFYSQNKEMFFLQDISVNNTNSNTSINVSITIKTYYRIMFMKTALYCCINKMHRPVKLNKDPINKTCIQSNQYKERTYGLRKSICWVFIWPKVKIQKLNKANITIQFKCSNAWNRYFSESKY